MSERTSPATQPDLMWGAGNSALAARPVLFNTFVPREVTLTLRTWSTS
jgi:hypothetical protein